MAILRLSARAGIVAAALLVAGCGGRKARSMPEAETQVGPLRTGQVKEIIERVVRVRQLDATRTVNVVRLDDAGMVAKLREALTASSSEEEDAALVAFNLHGENRADIGEIVEELVLGLYDSEEHAIYYRGAARNTKEQLLKQRLVIAHEVHHALQHDAFGAAKMPDHLDGALALDALYEGDAQVTMAAFAGSEYGVPLNRTLRTIFDINDQVRSEEVLHDRSVSKSVAVTKSLLLFAYEEGMRFVADIHRAGGLELVNSLYGNPPVSTEQILHPNKYLAGEVPTPVAEATAPPGYRIIESDRFGEFGMSQVLLPCVGEPAAIAAAAGWAGDHYAVAVDEQAQVTLLWSTVWDSEERAKSFADLVAGHRDCFAGNDARKYTVPDHLTVRHEDRRVALVSGIAPEAAEAIAGDLLALVGQAPTYEEVSPKRVPEAEPIPEPSRGTARDQRYESPWLGVEAALPTGMHATVSEIAEVEIRRSGEAYAALFISDRVHTEGYNEATFEAIHANAVEGAGAGYTRLDVLSSHVATTPLGQGPARLWGSEVSGLRLRVILIPVCYGTGSYVFVQAYRDDVAQKVVEGWIDSFRWTSVDPPPICKKLNPR